jgi:CMP-2-keto-3-deoxyoctulosonic acid synthetase
LAEKLEQLRALHLGGRIAVVPAQEAGIGVDTPEDVAYAESIAKKGGRV